MEGNFTQIGTSYKLQHNHGQGSDCKNPATVNANALSPAMLQKLSSSSPEMNIS
jgi:hypothetical protein